MMITAIVCMHCKDILFSRTEDDTRVCSCGQSCVKGGTTNPQIGYKQLVPITITWETSATHHELFLDWAKNIDQYGLVKSMKNDIKIERTTMEAHYAVTTKDSEYDVVQVHACETGETTVRIDDLHHPHIVVPDNVRGPIEKALSSFMEEEKKRIAEKLKAHFHEVKTNILKKKR